MLIAFVLSFISHFYFIVSSLPLVSCGMSIPQITIFATSNKNRSYQRS